MPTVQRHSQRRTVVEPARHLDGLLTEHHATLLVVDDDQRHS